MLAAEKYRGSTRSDSTNAAGLPVRFSTSRIISSCPAEKLLALDRVDQQTVRLIVIDVVDQHVDTHRQAAVGVDAEAIFGQRLQRLVWIMTEAEIVNAADLGVARRNDDR